MTIDVVFKSPDAVDIALSESNLSPEQETQARILLSQYVRWGELLRVRVDLSCGVVFLVKGG